jgi:hypothetical protein
MSFEADSNDPNVPGLSGKNTAAGFGVRGDSPSGFAAVHGNGGKNGVWGYTVPAGSRIDVKRLLVLRPIKNQRRGASG